MTLTDIANLALESIGHKAISSIDSNDFEAQRIKRHIYNTIDKVASQRNWICLGRCIDLVVSSKTADGRTRFLLPKNLMSISSRYPGKRFGLEIVAHCEAISIECFIASYDPNEWEINFKNAVLAQLVADITLPITGDAKLALSFRQLAEVEIGRYMRNDIFNEKPRHIQNNTSWVPSPE